MGITEVDPGGTAREAASACDVADDLRRAAWDWRTALDLSDSTFGLQEATEALTAMRDAWKEDFAVYHEVVREWCRATEAAAAGYQTVDDYVADQQRRVPRPGPQYY